MIYLFCIMLVYLLCVFIYGLIAYFQIEEFQFSMGETLIEKKTRSIKSRYKLLLGRM